MITLCFSFAFPCIAGAAPVFRSSFEDGTRIEPGENGLFIRGIDSATGADWLALGKSGSAIPALRSAVYINTGDRNRKNAGAEIVTTAPASSSNRALRLWVLDDDPASAWVTRAAVRLDYRYGSADRPDFAFQRGHIKFRMFLAAEYPFHLGTAKSEWFQIFELWDCGREWRQAEMSLEIKVVKSGSNYHLGFQKRIKGTNGKFTVVHQKQNSSYSLPFGRWVQVDFYYNAGFGDEAGRFLWRMDDTTVFDITAGEVMNGKPVALHEGRPIMNIQPIKIYQSDAFLDRMRIAGTPCQAWFDDFEYSETALDGKKHR